METADRALGIAALYRHRWAIEQVFRTMKRNGFDIEALSIGAAAPRNRLVPATFIAAVTVMRLVGARDGAGGCDDDGPPNSGARRPLTDAFDPEDRPVLPAFSARLEGRTARQKNPHTPDSLGFAAWVSARLGGWTGSYGKLGPIVILNGGIKFQSSDLGVHLIHRRIV